MVFFYVLSIFADRDWTEGSGRSEAKWKGPAKITKNKVIGFDFGREFYIPIRATRIQVDYTSKTQCNRYGIPADTKCRGK